MEIPVSCQCGKSFKAKSSLAGKTVACPSCKSPITIPAAPTTAAPAAPAPPAAPQPPAPAPAPAVPVPGAEILLACGCGQHFKVDSQFAGQQVNCPACQVLCVIPNPQQQQIPFPGIQTGPTQPAVQQPMMQQPVAQQPMMQPPPGFAPGMGMAPQPDYQQPAYSGSHRASYKTGLGIFIFAIAACVFAGGFGFQRLAEGITQLRSISARASSSSNRSSGGNVQDMINRSRASADAARTLNNITSALTKIGAIAILLGMIAIVVACVFCIMSPSPLMALGITDVCVAATAGILLAIYEIVPTLRDSFGFSSIITIFGVYGGDVADALLSLLVRFTEIGTFLIFAIFLMYAFRGKQRRGVYPEQPKIALITFSISAGIHLFLVILHMIEIRGEWVVYFYMFVRWLAHAGMIVGLVFIIKTSFEAKAVYRV